MNSFQEQDNNKKTCICTSISGLFIPNRRLSLVTAAGILIVFITFITGYFIGQHSAIESFSNKIDQESFADQIYASLFAPGEYKSSRELSEQENEQITQGIEVLEEKSDMNTKEIVQADYKGEQQSIPSSLIPKEEYYAQLIGFGTEQAAQKFAQRLIKQKILVTVKRRRSKTAKGKMVSWYQVVTQKYNDKEKLCRLVDRIEKTEKIKGTHIISC